MKFPLISPFLYFLPSFLSLSTTIVEVKTTTGESTNGFICLSITCINFCCFLIFVLNEKFLSFKFKFFLKVITYLSLASEITTFFQFELIFLKSERAIEQIVISQRIFFLGMKCLALYCETSWNQKNFMYLELIFILNTILFFFSDEHHIELEKIFVIVIGSIAILINYPLILKSGFAISKSIRNELILDLVKKSTDSMLVIKQKKKQKIFLMSGLLFDSQISANNNHELVELNKSKINTLFDLYDSEPKSLYGSLKNSKNNSRNPLDVSFIQKDRTSNLILSNYLSNRVKDNNDSPFLLKVCLKENTDQKYLLKISSITYNQSNAKFFILNFSEITHQEENIRLKKIIESNKRFFCSFSHELKTPINGCLPILENVIRIKSLNKEGNNLLEYATVSLKLLHNSIDNIINFYLLESNQLFISLSDFVLRDIIEEINNIMVPMTKLKKLEFSIIFESQFEKFKLKTDYEKLKQLLLNLLTNAVQFTKHPGKIKLFIEVVHLNPLNLKFSVQDTGIGINESRLNQLIVKLDNDDVHENQINSTGSCFGLITCQRLAFFLGDEGIKIRSKEGEGSTFEFFINAGNFLLESTKKTVISNTITSKSFYDALTLVNFNTLLIEEVKKDQNIEKMSFDDFNLNSSQRSSYKNTDLREKLHMKYNLPAKFFPLGSLPYSPKKNHIDFSKKSRNSCNSLTNSIFKLAEENKIEFVPNIFSASHYSEVSLVTVTKTRKNQSIEFLKRNCDCKDILAVDDDAFNLLSLELICNSFNLKIAKAIDGKAALEKLRKRKHCPEGQCKGFKLIFMDYQMPVMDGIETTVEIVKLIKSKEMEKVPIIGCTAFVTKDQVLMCLNVGMNDVIFKPITKNIIKSILEKWISTNM